MWFTFNVVLLQPFSGIMKFYFNNFTFIPCFCMCGRFRSRGMIPCTTYILLLVSQLIKNICLPRVPLLLFRHGWILRSKYSEICITVKPWIHLSGIYDLLHLFSENMWVFFLAKMLEENKKSHEYLYKGSRLGMFIRAFSNLRFSFFSHLVTDHKY